MFELSFQLKPKGSDGAILYDNPFFSEHQLWDVKNFVEIILQ